jgi:hypothetical protein
MEFVIRSIQRSKNGKQPKKEFVKPVRSAFKV